MAGLNNTMRAMILETQWLSPQSKLALIQKLQQTQTRIAAPDVWHPEPFAQSILPDAYDHNLNMIRRYRVQRNLALWNQPFTPMSMAFFAMPLTEVNAYYSGPSNSITILAGILQPPFYDYTYNTVSKYAVLGSIIAHEMSHLLDTNGMFWDAFGSLQLDGIASAEDVTAFFQQTECVVEQYGPAPGGCDDLQVPYGNQTVSEDMADLMGINMSYRALFDLQTERPLGDKQHFFMVLAQAFCESYDQTHLCEVVQTDVHAVAEFRIDRTLRNIPAFRAAFTCHEGQRMWRPASDICKVYGA
jgi:putative endopeptidase